MDAKSFIKCARYCAKPRKLRASVAFFGGLSIDEGRNFLISYTDAICREVMTKEDNG